MYQQVAYLMRSGRPDSLDLMVATNYAVMAADLAVEGASGRMVALRGGTYTAVPLSVTREGVKRVDVGELYDSRELPAQGPPRHRQADVPLLADLLVAGRRPIAGHSPSGWHRLFRGGGRPSRVGAAERGGASASSS